MGSRLGRRVIHFANLPIKLLMPNRLSNIDEIALKTIPSATKVEIRRVLESLYGFEVAEVRTLNMEGKKKKRGGVLLARPDYKKAYVTLRRPLSISADLFPLRLIADAKTKADKPSGPTVVAGAESEPRKHWLHGREVRAETHRPSSSSSLSSFGRGNGGAKFPWSSMKSKSSSDSSKGSR